MTSNDIIQPTIQETTNILNWAQDKASFEKILKYNRGDYSCGGELVPIGTKVVAHCRGCAEEWIKFKDGQFIERQIFRISCGQVTPERAQLDEKDQTLWEKRPDGSLKDPWNLRQLLPMEMVETDEPMIFVTASQGGLRAVADLCATYARRKARDPNCGQPIIRLETTSFPHKVYGKVAKPKFEIVGWDDGKQVLREVSEEALRKSDFDDSIPF